MKTTLRYAGTALLLAVLSGCANKPSAFTPSLPEPDHQYICKAGFVLGEPTRTFNLRTHYRGQDLMIQLGEPLSRQVAARFWSDAVAAHSGRPQAVVAIGFDARTATKANDKRSDSLQVGLQYQIFKPTGQSWMDIVGGRSTASQPEVAAAEALSQALRNLESVLVNAGICRAAH